MKIEKLLKILICIVPVSVFIKKIEIVYITVFCIVALVYLIRNNNLKFLIMKTPLMYYFGFLIISMITELILFITHVDVFKDSFSPYVRVVIYYVIMMLIVNLSKNKNFFDEIIDCIIVSSILPNFFAILQFKYDIFTIIYSYEGNRRIGSTFIHPNFYAFYIVLVVICLLYKKSKTDNTIKANIINYLYIGLNCVLIIFTFSRTPLFILIIIMLINCITFMFFNRNDKYFKIAFACFGLAALSIGIYLVLNSDIFINSRFNMSAEINSGSFTWRLEKWKSSILYWIKDAKNVFIGCGWVTARFFTTNPAYINYDMHNEFLRIIFDTGILGFIMYFLFFVKVITKAYRLNQSKNKRILMINLVLLLVIGGGNDNILIVPENSIIIFIMLITFYSNSIYWNEKKCCSENKLIEG